MLCGFQDAIATPATEPPGGVRGEAPFRQRRDCLIRRGYPMLYASRHDRKGEITQRDFLKRRGVFIVASSGGITFEIAWHQLMRN